MTSSTTNKRGFTLVELLAVIAIMAMIVAVGMPALKALSSTGLATGARQFSNAMLLARQYAINKRTCVRVVLPVDLASITNSVGSVGSNYVCQAYSLYWGSNYVNGAYTAWWPLQDWRTLPGGVVFADHNTTWYTANLDTLSTVTLAPGSRLRTPGSSGTLAYDNYTMTMPIVTNITTGITYNFKTSYIEWRPTGVTTYGQVGGVRLMQGSVLDAGTRNIIITDTGNWVYVEYDGYAGRVRTRYPESWQ